MSSSVQWVQKLAVGKEVTQGRGFVLTVGKASARVCVGGGRGGSCAAQKEKGTGPLLRQGCDILTTAASWHSAGSRGPGPPAQRSLLP